MGNKKTLYKNEMKALRARHNLYRPELLKLLDYHNNYKPGSGVIEFTEPDEMILLCELLSVGYIDEEAVIVQKRNGDIYSVIYNLNYPLTESGEAAVKLKRWIHAERWKIILLYIITGLIIAAAYVLLMS